jgi:hypothetical protein
MSPTPLAGYSATALGIAEYLSDMRRSAVPGEPMDAHDARCGLAVLRARGEVVAVDVTPEHMRRPRRRGVNAETVYALKMGESR